jgi:hypothetical protein
LKITTEQNQEKDGSGEFEDFGSGDPRKTIVGKYHNGVLQG